MMQTNSVKKLNRSSRPEVVSSGGETKQLRKNKVQTRKIPCVVGFSWNRGGRLNELRRRHLARKFLKIWMRRTFGRVLPHEAKFHYNCRVLRRVFEGWRDEWWISRREWSLIVRADCHYRFVLFAKTLHGWRVFISLQRKKKTKMQRAQSLADGRRVRWVWEEWKVFTELRRTHRRMLESALEHRRLSNSAWRLWQMGLQQQEELQAPEQAALKLQNKAWLVWKEMHKAACSERAKESKAVFFFTARLKKQMFSHWISYTCHRKTKKTAQAVAQRAWSRRLTRKYWNKWRKALNEKLRLQAVSRLAVRSIQRRALEGWKAYVKLCREEAERNQTACQHFHHRLLYAGLRGLSLNVVQNRARRLNNNMAVQHCQQTMMRKYWKLWKEHLEEADLRLQMAQTNYRVSLMRSCFHLWKFKIVQQKHMQFVQKQREKKVRLKEIQSYHQVKLLKLSFEAWKKHHAHMIQMNEQAEEFYRQRMKLFLRKVFTLWREKVALLVAEQQAQNHFQQFLQLKVFVVWREATTRAALQRRQQREALRQLQRTVNQVRLLRSFRRWRKETRERRRQRRNLEKARQHYCSRLASKTLTAWSRYHQQHQTEKATKQQEVVLLRLKMHQKYFGLWKQKLQHRRREASQTERALWFWSLTLQAKVLSGWRLWAAEQRSRREQAARAAQVYRDQLLREGVSRILTYAARMNDLTTSLTQFSQEQKSQRLWRVVKRCALRWKERVLCRRPKEQEVRTRKKSVTFCLSEPTLGDVSTSGSEEQRDGALSRHAKTELGLHPARSSGPLIFTMTPPEPPASTSLSPLEPEKQDVLLPPAAFMTSRTHRDFVESSCSGFREAPLANYQSAPSFIHPISANTDSNLRAISRTFNDPRQEDESTSAESALTQELLRIQRDMKSFQQSRKQLRAWRKLREVLQRWLQMSAEEEQTEKTAVFEELKELEERINRLSAELETQKPTMLLHIERIRQLQSALHTAGAHRSNAKI